MTHLDRLFLHPLGLTRFLLLSLKVITFLARGFVPLAHGALFTFFKDGVLMLESADLLKEKKNVVIVAI